MRASRRPVLLRHGESVWNTEDRFAGWVDVPLSERGRDQARRCGELLAAAELLPDFVHTSLLRRAITTADLALDVADRHRIDVRRSWRLLVVAHGNVLRILIKLIDGLSADAVTRLDIPTGVPLRYDLTDALRPLVPGGAYLSP